MGSSSFDCTGRVVSYQGIHTQRKESDAQSCAKCPHKFVMLTTVTPFVVQPGLVAYCRVILVTLLCRILSHQYSLTEVPLGQIWLRVECHQPPCAACRRSVQQRRGVAKRTRRLSYASIAKACSSRPTPCQTSMGAMQNSAEQLPPLLFVLCILAYLTIVHPSASIFLCFFRQSSMSDVLASSTCMFVPRRSHSVVLHHALGF